MADPVDDENTSGVLCCSAASLTAALLWVLITMAIAYVAGVSSDGGWESEANAFGWSVVLPGIFVASWMVGPAAGVLLVNSSNARWSQMAQTVVAIGGVIATVAAVFAYGLLGLALLVVLLVPALVVGVIVDRNGRRSAIGESKDDVSNSDDTEST